MCGTATPCVVDNPSRPERWGLGQRPKGLTTSFQNQIIGSERASHSHNWNQPTHALALFFCIVWIGVIATNLWSILAWSPRTWLDPYPLRAFLAFRGRSVEAEGVKMGTCCSDSDDDTKLLGFVLALVLAMMLLIVCHPPHARRVTIYHCTWLVFSTILILGKLCFCRSFECLLNYLYRHSKCSLQLSSTM